MHTLDKRNSNTRYKINAMKRTIIDKDHEINHLKDELISIENFRKQKNDRDEIMKKYLEVKEELEKKTKLMRDLEKSNTEYKLKNDEYYIENQLCKRDNPQVHYIELLNANIKTLKKMKEENKLLKKELWKYEQKPEYDPNLPEDKSFMQKCEEMMNNQKNNFEGKFLF
jgi:hypothetical protein